MKFFKDIKNHLADNSGDENVSKLIWIVIAFVVGGLMLTLLSNAFSKGAVKEWFDAVFESWFNKGGEGGSLTGGMPELTTTPTT
jgi:hypothetical protein